MGYITVDGTVICKAPSEKELDQREIEQIVSHTANTWQRGRGADETRRDTVQGKKAELALEGFLHRRSQIQYLSYDKFREDGYQKHAPFDGILFRRDTAPKLLEYLVGRINDDVAGSDKGQIGAALRKELAACGVYTMEIKSSSLKKRDYEGVSALSGEEERVVEEDGTVFIYVRTEEEYQQIVNNIKRWDFFVYPYYKRKSEEIQTFYDYAESVRANTPDRERQQSNWRFLHDLIVAEYDNACDIYTRLYFDYETGEIYFPGYLKKGDFYKKPRIAHMPGGKSGQALYYMRSIADGRSFGEIDQDIASWHFGDEAAYGRLFAGDRRECIRCGADLQICNVRTRRAYRYRCYSCGAWYDMDEVNGAGR